MKIARRSVACRDQEQPHPKVLPTASQANALRSPNQDNTRVAVEGLLVYSIAQDIRQDPRVAVFVAGKTDQKL